MSFTRIGSNIWSWAPFVSMPSAARCLWLAMYTCAEAKRLPAGLWHGGVGSLMEAAAMDHHEVVSTLDLMLEPKYALRESTGPLIEYDQKLRVIRLVELPDAGEEPMNGKAIKGWYTKFITVPPCAVRDAHVSTIRWLIDEGARSRNKRPSADHEQAWDETFGKVQIPVPRRRGVRRLLDADTSTAVQPSLFHPRASDPLPDTHPDTVSDTHSEPSPETDRSDPVHSPSASSPDQKNQVSGYGIVYRSGSETESEPDPEFFRSFPEGGDQVTAAGEIAYSRAPRHAPRPTLRLVPPAHAPFTVEQLLGILNNQGLVVRESERGALCDAITTLVDIPEGEDTLALLKGWRRMTVLELVRPGALADEVARARAKKQQAAEYSQALREARERAGYEC